MWYIRLESFLTLFEDAIAKIVLRRILFIIESIKEGLKQRAFWRSYPLENRVKARANSHSLMNLRGIKAKGKVNLVMKVAILAGGLGTRLSEETTLRPKPMVEIGNKPILWHIMNIYAAYGFREFVIALGYKGEIIKDYFINYHYRAKSLTVQLENGEITTHMGSNAENWTVHLLDTGIETQTGGRVKRVAKFVGDEPFMLTYGDGVGNVNIEELGKFHKEHGRLVTMTAVRPPARFGQIIFDGNMVKQFEEKPQTSEGWINGGFFVLNPQIMNYIEGDDIAWERQPLERLAQEGEVMAYRHSDFWQCMDTLRDVQLLNDLWNKEIAPWKLWN